MGENSSRTSIKPGNESLLERTISQVVLADFQSRAWRTLPRVYAVSNFITRCARFLKFAAGLPKQFNASPTCRHKCWRHEALPASPRRHVRTNVCNAWTCLAKVTRWSSNHQLYKTQRRSLLTVSVTDMYFTVNTNGRSGTRAPKLGLPLPTAVVCEARLASVAPYS